MLYLLPVTAPGAHLNQDPNHWENPPEENSISISEMFHFLRKTTNKFGFRLALLTAS